jgi:hypothetical protein
VVEGYHGVVIERSTVYEVEKTPEILIYEDRYGSGQPSADYQGGLSVSRGLTSDHCHNDPNISASLVSSQLHTNKPKFKQIL